MLGKRNLNCLSCGTKEGQTITGAPAPTSHTNIWGKDGRIYRGVGNNISLDMNEAYTSR